MSSDGTYDMDEVETDMMDNVEERNTRKTSGLDGVRSTPTMAVIGGLCSF